MRMEGRLKPALYELPDDEEMEEMSARLSEMRAEWEQERERNATLRAIARDLHWMARRYADGRMSYVTSLFNDRTRTLLALGVPLKPTGDGTVWARDGMGRAYDHLTDDEAAQGRGYDFTPSPDMAAYERLRAALLTIQQHYGQVCAEYEACDHPACLSSYSAWAIADGALSEAD